MKNESPRDASFDPRSWVGPEVGGTGTPAPPPRPMPKVANGATPRRAPVADRDRVRWSLAAAASIVILLIGAGLARGHRTAMPPAGPAATSTLTGG